MAEHEENIDHFEEEDFDLHDAGTATDEPRQVPSKTPPKLLPMWKVLLHNDDINTFDFVIDTVVMLTTLRQQEAKGVMHEAHYTGVALLLTTHQERAELYQQQFASRGMTVTIEPAD